MKNILLLFILCVFMSCNNDGKIEDEIAAVDIDFTVERFDRAFAEADSSNLHQLKKAYPFMFSARFDDAFWLEKIEDSIQKELVLETNKVFEDFKTPRAEIKSLFQHLKYYEPTFKTPRVITTTSSVDYRNKVIVTDTIVLISIDTYLGAEHKFYQGIQKYIREDFEQKQIVVDLASAYGKKAVFQENKTFLDEMIYFGKQLYFKDIMIPFKSDAEKIAYTQNELEWSMANESQIWSYFVEREMLFSTDPKLSNRFIANAPFSKFQLTEIDNESPGRIGQYIGWQIVKAYMDKNPVSMLEMMTTPAEELFNKSNYKPRK